MKIHIDDNCLWAIDPPFNQNEIIITGCDTINSYSINYCVGGKCNDATVLRLSDDIRCINEYASDLQRLETLYIGKNIQSIKRGAFTNCTNLKNVWFSCSKSSIKKLSPFAFPETAALHFEGEDEEEKVNESSLSLKDAKKRFKVSKRADGYAIIGFAGVEWELGERGKVGYFEDRKPHVIEIPDVIEGIDVSDVKTGLVPNNAIVVCSLKWFAKLSKTTKISTATYYLSDHTLFNEKSDQHIREFIKKNISLIIDALPMNFGVDVANELFEIASVKKKDADALLLKTENVEARAFILSKLSKK